MNEKLSAPIPDINAYLKRIKIERPSELNEESLDEIIMAHQINIPFENLDVIRKVPLNLETEALFRKIIINRRGGYCFELNGLFCKFLKSLGFDAYNCRCRITRGKKELSAIMHRGNIVNIENSLYYCDVGFGGPQPSFCVKIEDGFEKNKNNETFFISRPDEFWYALGRKTESGTEEVLRFTLMPEEDIDFATLNWYCSNCPDSIFTQTPMLNRRLENGNVSLTGTEFIKKENGLLTKKTVDNKELFYKLAKEEFGIKISSDLA